MYELTWRESSRELVFPEIKDISVYICFKIVAGVGGIVQGGQGGQESRQGSLVSHHRHTHASCRKALQTCPRQLTSPKVSSASLMAWHVLPTTTGAQCQSSCTGLPAAPAPLAETSTPSQELLLWREHPALIAGTCQMTTVKEKNCHFFLA